MAKERKSPAAQPATSPDLPTTLAELVEKAKLQAAPQITDQERETLPELWVMMCPRWIDTGSLDGNGKPRLAWAESMMSIVWDAGLGEWRWTVTSKALNTRISGSVPTLVQAMEQIEAKIKLHACIVKQVKPR